MKRTLFTTALALVVGFGATIEADAQFLLKGSNGSATPLAPLSMDKKTVRSLTQNNSARADFASSGQEYFLVAYDRIPSAALQEKIAGLAKMVGYLPDYMYLYAASNSALTAPRIVALASSELTVKATGAIPFEFKLGGTLYQAVKAQRELTVSEQSQGLEVSVFEATDFDALCTTLARWDIAYDTLSATSVVVKEASLNTVKQLATIPYVNSVGLYVAPQKEEDAPGIQYIMRTNMIDIVNYDRKGPIGRGVTFMNWERYGAQAYFPINAYGRTLSGNRGDNYDNGHGSTVGNIVAGANNIGEWGSGGMAPGMTYLSSAGGTDGFINGAVGATNAMNAGFSPLVSNFSVGWTKGDVGYGDLARQIDVLAYNTNKYLHFFSAGNNSDGKFNNYTKTGYSTITGSAKTAKNGLIVHSTDFPGVDVAFTAFGPTQDGRMKPDISAQGTAGTSFASPGVAGLAGVLMEQYATTYGTPARADVVKAVILNSAMRLRVYTDKDTGIKTDTVNYITYRSGFGQINPLAAVEAITERRIETNTISQGETKEFVVNIPEGQTEARFMLYYHDPAAVAGAAKTLVNDLDLEVVTPNNETILPWTLSPAVDSVHLPPVRKVNRIDNVEQVVITAANKGETLRAGAYTLRVRGHIVPLSYANPNYVLTWQYRPRGIRLTSMPKGYRIPVAQYPLLAWELTLAANENKLIGDQRKATYYPTVQFRTSEAGSWTNVNAHQNKYGANYFFFVATEAMKSNETQFRVQIDDMEAISNKVQVENRYEPAPKIEMFSPSAVRLSWGDQGITSGKVYIHALYDKYMTVIDSIDHPATSKTVQAPAGVTFGENTYFAISHFNGATKAQSVRSLPIALTQDNPYASDPDTKWPATTFTLCAEDTIVLKTLATEGTIQWYSTDGTTATPIAAKDGGNARSRTFKAGDSGMYYYTLSTGTPASVIFTSPTATIISPDLKPSDAERWGEGMWHGVVYRDVDANPSSGTIYKEGLPLYGKFSLMKLGFNTHTDLYAWDTDLMLNIPRYVGCEVPGSSNNHIIVMKRKAFAPGTYTFRIVRAANRARIIFRDGNGTIILNKLSGQNSSNEASFTVTLDENSSCEVQWMGEHFVLEVTPPNGLTIKDGYYYRITSTFPGYFDNQKVTKSIYHNYDTNSPYWGTTDATAVNQLFQLKANTVLPQFSAMSANAGTYLNNVGGALSPSSQVLKATDLTQQQYNIISNGQTYHTNNHYNGTGTGSNIVSWAGGSNSASSWTFDLVLSVDLNVSAAGYATAYYPFAIKVPATEGVEVYYPTVLNNNSITFEPLPAGTSVAAKTPLLIKAPKGTYTFYIDYNNKSVSSVTNSAFRGTLAPAYLPLNSYVLNVKEGEGVGFYPVVENSTGSASKLGANKIYYVAPTSGSPAFIGFSLSGVTGVNGVSTTTSAQPAYDLSGRPVSQPKGLFIDQQGNKKFSPSHINK